MIKIGNHRFINSKFSKCRQVAKVNGCKNKMTITIKRFSLVLGVVKRFTLISHLLVTRLPWLKVSEIIVKCSKI